MAEKQSRTMKIAFLKVSDNVYEIAIERDVDLNSAPRVEQMIEKLFAQKIFRIILNLSKTNYVSSTGFGIFMWAVETAIRNGGETVFVGVSAKIKQVFDLFEVPDTFRFFPTREEALKHLNGSA